ncbi:MAG TPA: hypothetical protein VF181_01755 [Balneolaceae bacterium]
MKKSLLVSLIIAFCLLNLQTNAQSSLTKETSRNHLFIELVGSGGFYSLNYERMVNPKLYVRLGLSYLNTRNAEIQFPDGEVRRSTKAFTVPIFVGRLIGKNNHYFEVGAGVIPNLFLVDEANPAIEDEFFLYGGLIVGYRYQPDTKGIIFRAGFTPWFTFKEFIPLPGLSIGYRF